MLHSDHIKQAITNSYFKAQHLALCLKEYAKQRNIDTRGIRILNKHQIIKRNLGNADAQVQWLEGPDDWTYFVSFNDDPSVGYIIDNGNTISFYDQ